MALAVRQVIVSSRVSATSIARAYSAVLSGSLLVAVGAVFNGNGDGEPTITDSVNGAWGAAATTGFAIAGDSNSELWCWSFPNSASGTPTVTMDPPGTPSDNDLVLLEITGAATSSPRDIVVTNSAAYGPTNQAVTMSVVTGTLAQANEILISAGSHTGVDRPLEADTADSFTLADEDESNTTGQTFLVQYKIVAATSSVTVNTEIQAGANSSGTWFTGVASFQESSDVLKRWILGTH